jgi:hypothetical protein
VQQGSYNVATLPATSFVLSGSPVPLGGDISALNTQLGLVPAANDSITTFNGTANDWNAAVKWNGKTSAWGSALTINPGQGFLYFNAASSPKTWVSNFTVQ